MILALMIAALAAQAPSPVGADAGTAWQLLKDDSAGTVFIDPAGISRDGDIARVRIKIIAPPPRGDVDYAIMRILIDCPGRRDSFDAGAMFTRAGQVVNARERRPDQAPEWAAIADGSAANLMHQRACGGAAAR